jgi:hypothetical protein
MNNTIKDILELELDKLSWRKSDLQFQIDIQRTELKSSELELAECEQRYTEIQAYINSELTL